MEQKVLRSSTTPLITYPRVRDAAAVVLGVPSSVGVRIRTPAVAMPVAFDTGTPVVENTSVTVPGALADGATAIALGTPKTFHRGHRYLLTDVVGGEVCEITSASEGSVTTLQLAEPLPLAFAANATISSHAITCALTAPQTAIEGECIALWQATVLGVVYDWAQPFRIVRRMAIPTLTPTSLQEKWPTIRQLRSRADVDFEESIAQAWEDDILPLLEAKDISPEDIISIDALEPLHALAVLRKYATTSPTIIPEVWTRIEKRWLQLIETTFAREDWYEADQHADPPSHEEGDEKAGGAIRIIR